MGLFNLVGRRSQPALETPAPEQLVPTGSLDFAGRKMVSGWALPVDGAAHATVAIMLDGQTLATVVADRPRPDLVGVVGRGDVGFAVPLDLPRDESSVVVAAQVVGAARPLQDSPKTVPPISQVQTVDNPGWYRNEVSRFLLWRFEEAAFIGGIYNGHQPIYGFGLKPCEPGWLERYTITHAIMTELARLDFSTLVDIGGAEGYKGAMIREMFGAQVVSADLSREACALAERIYGLDTKVVTMEALPFADDSFDVVLCSESLEHVSQPALATAELLRIAKHAVIITVPAEPVEQVATSIQSGDLHAHVNWFDLRAFDYAKPDLHDVRTRPILNTDPDWRAAGAAAENLVRMLDDDRDLRQAARNMIAALVVRDAALLGQGAGFNGMVAVLQKRPCLARTQPTDISIDRIMDFAVPFYRRPA